MLSSRSLNYSLFILFIIFRMIWMVWSGSVESIEVIKYSIWKLILGYHWCRWPRDWCRWWQRQWSLSFVSARMHVYPRFGCPHMIHRYTRLLLLADGSGSSMTTRSSSDDYYVDVISVSPSDDSSVDVLTVSPSLVWRSSYGSMHVTPLFGLTGPPSSTTKIIERPVLFCGTTTVSVSSVRESGTTNCTKYEIGIRPTAGIAFKIVDVYWISPLCN